MPFSFLGKLPNVVEDGHGRSSSEEAMASESGVALRIFCDDHNTKHYAQMAPANEIYELPSTFTLFPNETFEVVRDYRCEATVSGSASVSGDGEHTKELEETVVATEDKRKDLSSSKSKRRHASGSANNDASASQCREPPKEPDLACAEAPMVLDGHTTTSISREGSADIHLRPRVVPSQAHALNKSDRLKHASPYRNQRFDRRLGPIVLP